MKFFQKYATHFYAILGFIVLSVLYFYPVLSGKQLYQSDIAQYVGMAKEQIEFRKEFNEEPYWTNSAFGGMPTYQLGAKYPHNYIKSLDSVLRFLPRPADYVFLYFLGFYVLMMSLNVRGLKAFIGAVAFGFSTYLIIVLSPGHNAKVHAVAYIPFVLAGIFYVFQKRYLLGFILTLLATALEIQANHFQMTYYFLFLIFMVVAFEFYNILKTKDFSHLKKSLAIFMVSVVLAIGLNASSLLATSEYAKFSTRSDSELTIDEKGKKKESKNAMTFEYITEYSYGIFESLNLISPNITGGGNSEDLGKDSAMYQFALQNNLPESDAKNFVNGMPTYWGSQPIVEAPAYIGITVFFLAIFSLFIVQNRIKYVLSAAILLSLFLSYGKNFEPLTRFFINYVPLYNKFRAVSSIQVILELCFPVLAALALNEVSKKDPKDLIKPLLKTATIVGVIILGLLLASGSLDFSGSIDKQLLQAYGLDFVNVLKEDRKSMYFSSLWRSLFFAFGIFAALYLFLKNKMKLQNSLIIIGVLIFVDLVTVNKKYVNADNFVSKSQIEKPYEETEADLKVLQDTTHFRVFDVDGGFNSAKASYFHNSIGGYSAVKPKKIQELFDYHISNGNMEILNMLNTKYLLRTVQQSAEDKEGTRTAIENPETNGNAWFVSEVKKVNTADEEIKALAKFDSKKTAIYRQSALEKGKFNFDVYKDSTSNISLKSYKANELIYQSNNTKNGFAVFSEIYYPQGWQATIDGKKATIENVNYVLRGLQIPAGNHKIVFKFEPQVVKTGSTIALITAIITICLFAGLFWWSRKNLKTEKA